jgi:hypothetical protein
VLKLYPIICPGTIATAGPACVMNWDMQTVAMNNASLQSATSSEEEFSALEEHAEKIMAQQY